MLQLHLLSQCIPRKFPSVPKYSLFKPWQLHSEYLHTVIMLLLTIYEQSFICSTLVLVPNITTIPSFDLLVPGIIPACCQHLFILMMLTIKYFSSWIFWDLPRGLPFWDIFWDIYPELGYNMVLYANFRIVAKTLILSFPAQYLSGLPNRDHLHRVI